MTEKKSEAKQGFITGGVTVGTALLFLLGGALVLLGWKYLQNSSQNTAKAQELQQSYMSEIEELQGYMSTGAYDQAGLDIREKNLTDKAKLLESYGTSWITSLSNGVTKFLEDLGLYVFVPAIALIITGAVIYILIKHWPKQPPTFRDPKTGLVYTDAAALKLAMEQHQGSSDSVSISSAQALFLQQSDWVQSAVAAESGVYTGAYRDWHALSSGNKVNLAYGLAAVGAYGVGMGTLAPIAALLLV